MLRMDKHGSVEKLCRGIQRCQRCERRMTRTHAVPGEGSPDAGLFLFGEAPGKTEDKTGRPFVGRAGQYLNAVLNRFSIKRDDIFITSILKCYHPETPKKPQMRSCISWTKQQIEAIRPGHILVMGKSAAWGLFGIDRLGADPLDLEWQGIPCVVTCHPAAAMRFPERDRQFQRDFQRVVSRERQTRS